MTSAGGLVAVGDGGRAPGRRCCCRGPAGGVLAGAAVGRRPTAAPDAVTFDMGGTQHRRVPRARRAARRRRRPRRRRVRRPAAVARRAHHRCRRRLDRPHRRRRRARRSGPASAGAVPGPACYGRGGTEPTVTDADLVAGRIPADAALPGLGRLDRGAAQARARRRRRRRPTASSRSSTRPWSRRCGAVSVERGVDPRGLALVAFGGAGPLHACALADALGMPAVIVPARAGVLSAVGLLGAPRQVDLVRVVARPGRPRRRSSAGPPRWRERGRRTVAGTRRRGRRSRSTAATRARATSCAVADGRRRSHAEHERRNGYARPDAPGRGGGGPGHGRGGRAGRPSPTVRRLPATGAAPVGGPAVIAEPDCTIWVPPTAGGRDPGAGGALVLDGGRADVSLDPAALQVLICAADRGGRGDGRGAAPGRVQPEHQGAGRLLGGGVHAGRRAAGPGRAHPGPPRLDAGVGARRPSTRSPAVPTWSRATRSSSTTRSPAAPTSTTSRSWRRAFVDGRLVGWVANRAHHADVGGVAPGLDARPTRPRSSQEGLRIPPVRLTAEVRALLLANSRTPVERGGDLDAQVGANVVGARPAGRAVADAAAATRCSTTASGGCGPRWPALPDGTWRSRTSSTRSVPRPTSRSPSHHRGRGDRSTATRSPSTSPAPTRSGRATSTRSRR